MHPENKIIKMYQFLIFRNRQYLNYNLLIFIDTVDPLIFNFITPIHSKKNNTFTQNRFDIINKKISFLNYSNLTLNITYVFLKYKILKEEL